MYNRCIRIIIEFPCSLQEFLKMNFFLESIKSSISSFFQEIFSLRPSLHVFTLFLR